MKDHNLSPSTQSTLPKGINNHLPSPQEGLSYSEPVKKKHSIGFIFGVITLLILIIGLTGSVAAYVTGFWGRDLEPQEVIGKMFVSLPDIASAEYSMNLDVSTEPREIESVIDTDTAVDPAVARDQERLDDAYTLLTAIHRYKSDGGGNGIYFPRTLLEIVPSGDVARVSQALDDASYGYSQEEDGTNFTFAIEMETKQAFDAAINSPLASVSRAALSSNSTIISMDKNNFPYQVTADSSENAKSSIYSSIPADFYLSLGMTGYNKANDSDNILGEYTFDGSLKMDGTTLEASGDLVLDNETMYLRLNEFPDLGIINLSPIKFKWVKLDQSDFSSQGERDVASEELVIDHYSLLLKMAYENDMVIVTEEHPKVLEKNRELYHYEISLDRNKLADFYKSYTQEVEAKFGDKALIKYEAATFQELQGQAFQDAYDEFEKHTSMELWIDDKTFHPAKVSFNMLFVPPDTATQLQERQVKTIVSIGLDKVNQPVEIVVPSEFITTEEAQKLIYGPSYRGAQGVRGIIDRVKETE